MSDFYNLFQSTSFAVAGVGMAAAEPGHYTAADAHCYARVWFVRAGTLSLTLTTGRQSLGAGTLCFTPADRLLSYDCTEAAEFAFVDLVPNVFTDHFLPLPVFRRALSLDFATADGLLRPLIEHHAAADSRARIVTDGSLRLLLSRFFRDGVDAATEQELVRFAPVFAFLDAHIDATVRLSELAEQLSMNPVYFSNLFKRVFGMSPQQYIQKRRLDYAYRRLADRQLPIAAVASELHFYDPAAFTSFFKKNTGMTPKEFRARLYGE